METGRVADPSMVPLMVVGTVALGRTFTSVPSGDWDGSRPFFILQVKPGTITDLSLVPKVDTGIG